MGLLNNLLWEKKVHTSGFEVSSPSGVGKVLIPLFAIIILVIVLTGGTFIFKLFNEVVLNPVKGGQISVFALVLIGVMVFWLFNRSKVHRYAERQAEFELQNYRRR